MTGEDIKNLRKKLGLTQQEFADKLGITRDAVKLWEMGYRKPSPLAVFAIQTVFGKTRAKGKPKGKS